MTTQSKELEAAVLSLPREERARMVHKLIASLEHEDALDEAWREEIRSRLASYQNGEVEAIPAQEVFAQAREIFER